jgi:hypothetical protein
MSIETTLDPKVSKKAKAYGMVTVRRARGGENPPLIISLPRDVAEAAHLNEGVKVIVYTDGEIVYVKRFEGPLV